MAVGLLGSAVWLLFWLASGSALSNAVRDPVAIAIFPAMFVVGVLQLMMVGLVSESPMVISIVGAVVGAVTQFTVYFVVGLVAVNIVRGRVLR